MFFFDPTYIFLVMIPTLILSGLAQMYLRNTYGTWSQRANSNDLMGPDTAERIIRRSGLQNVQLELADGELSDHYDPTSHTVRMSPDVAHTNSVASMAIVAHELGHAQQHQEGSAMIAARSFLLPAVQISPTVSYVMIIGGLLIGLSGLAWLGVAVFAISVAFMLLTLPIEFDASRRGLKLLEETGMLATDADRNGARSGLTAAALTYVAAAVGSVLQLLYWVSIVSSSRE